MNNLCILQNNFHEIKNINESCIIILNRLQTDYVFLNNLYKEMISTNLNELPSSLDSFYFQNKLIKTELSNNFDMLTLINNRIYGDYYKLLRRIFTYSNKIIKNKNLISNYSIKNYKIYKDLDISCNFDFNNTVDIFNDIISIIEILKKELIERKNSLSLQKNDKKSGLNIETLISSIKNNNTKLSNNISMFSENIASFNEYHKKYFLKFFIKIKLFYGEVYKEINFVTLREGKTFYNNTNNNTSIYILNNNEEKYTRDLLENNIDIDLSNIIIYNNNIERDIYSIFDNMILDKDDLKSDTSSSNKTINTESRPSTPLPRPLNVNDLSNIKLKKNIDDDTTSKQEQIFKLSKEIDSIMEKDERENIENIQMENNKLNNNKTGMSLLKSKKTVLGFNIKKSFI
tara:strand:- start:3373 stop:4578 length:1206 start_codon:yes stop_codon:yes gene_type:complete